MVKMGQERSVYDTYFAHIRFGNKSHGRILTICNDFSKLYLDVLDHLSSHRLIFNIISQTIYINYCSARDWDRNRIAWGNP
jgi:hypothetical protein